MNINLEDYKRKNINWEGLSVLESVHCAAEMFILILLGISFILLMLLYFDLKIMNVKNEGVEYF